MICKYCSAETPDGSVYCCRCGERLARKKREKTKEVKVPKPRQLKSGAWNIELRKEGESITAATAEACTEKARAVRAGYLKIEKAPPKQSLDDLITTYINSNAGVLSPSTVRGYESIRKTRFQDYMQEDINSINWQTMVSSEAMNVSPKTVANAWRLVTGAMKHAAFPVPSVNLPQKVKRETPWLDYEQITAFLQAVRGRKCELACLLALHSLRMSEILALGPESVQDGKILVRGAVVIDQDGEYVFKETNKTTASRRDIPVMIDRLTEIWPAEGQELHWQKHAAINSMLADVCEKAGLPTITMHGLRHSFASLAYHLGWDMMSTCYFGGWSTPSTVQRIYTHLAQQDKNKNVERMKAFYKKKTKRKITNEITNKNQNA